ncbi:uncharacterized protein Dana_GF15123, isoform B [Drosophila ananassae]|uniref:Uncharacterized protein, isoform B n=1 Tax=Drosophila ananassae TaxID=7217 RepID=A0A0P8XEM9_DROAN|nr:uncharacterized protein LOC6497936 isoform X2 [Drosophila ananassae]KPU73171.1 uncharacterized protein Dana_GF15123, isoform B [Drosophila ananassae]
MSRPEFNWEYSHGGNLAQQSPYRQSLSADAGGGRQWLHSNQAQTQAFMDASPRMSNHPQSSPSDPFSGYNQSIMNQYSNYKPNYGSSQIESMVQNPTPSPGYNRSMGMSEFSNSGMQNNGLGGGMSSRSRRGRLAGGFAGRNGLNDHHLPQAHQGSWF